jgi:hypothetical protein
MHQKQCETRGLNHLQFPDLGTGSGPPDWTPLVHHGTNELTVKHNTIPYRQFTPHVQKRPQHSQPLGSFLPNLVDVRRPGQPCVCDHSQITGSIDPLDWLPENLYWSGFLDAPASDEHRGALRDTNDDPTFSQPSLEI